MSRDTETQLDECKLMYRVNDVSLWAFAYTINTRRPPVDIFSEMRVRKKLKGVLVQQNIFFKKFTGIYVHKFNLSTLKQWISQTDQI